jgi:hypothetical protein
MATIGEKWLDLIDVYKRQDPDGSIVQIIEMLTEMNPILKDAIAVECNQATKHRHTVRSGLPSVTWGKLYKGIPNDKSQVSQVEDTTGFVEGLSEIDTRLLKLAGGNGGALRLQEAQSYIEAMNNEVANKLFYGNTADAPEEFMGLSPRFNDLSAANGNQIIDAGGTGSDNTSIWFVTWGANQTQLLYPQGTQAGVQREDKGEDSTTDASNNTYYVMRELFEWHVGLAVKDWRYVSRIANVDFSDMEAGSVALYDYMRKAYYKLQNRRVPGGTTAIYCNRDVLEALDALATNAGASDSFIRLTSGKDIQGEEVLMYRGIPIRETDALLNTEARVV